MAYVHAGIIADSGHGLASSYANSEAASYHAAPIAVAHSVSVEKSVDYHVSIDLF